MTILTVHEMHALIERIEGAGLYNVGAVRAIEKAVVDAIAKRKIEEATVESHSCPWCGVRVPEDDDCPKPPDVCHHEVVVPHKTGDVNPWMPMSSPRDLKVLGKLGEETGELSQVISRCIIQGVMESNPDNGKLNKRWLEEEIADVRANMTLVKERFDLDGPFIVERTMQKMAKLRQWHEMVPFKGYSTVESLRAEKALASGDPEVHLQAIADHAADQELISIGYQYEFPYPFGGTVWRDSSNSYNGNTYIASREVFVKAARVVDLGEND